jgi:hypothetical protein
MTTDDEKDIPDGRLLALPEDNALPRLLLPWTSARERKRIEDWYLRDRLEYEQAMSGIAGRQDRLLLRIAAEHQPIEKRRQEIEDNALRLHDGRRIYVEGDRYRDGQGGLLAGADEAEAVRFHEVFPDASTWASAQDIDRRAAEAQKLKDKVIADRESGQGTPQDQATRLDGYEKEFLDKVQERTPQPLADYGSADYMSDHQLSSVPAFTAAAVLVSHEAIRKLSDGDSGTQTSEMKKTSQPLDRGNPTPR